MLVLDSSALFSMEQLPEEESCCPPGVITELRRYKDHRLDLWGDLLHVSECTRESVRKVEEAARKSGDLGRLSPVDITVLALAVDVGGTVMTTTIPYRTRPASWAYHTRRSVRPA